MAITLQYRNRQVDLSAFTGWQAGQRVELGQSLAAPGNSGQAIAGILKLIQRFVLELFTETGSLIYLPTRGSDFVTKARQGRLRTHLDVRQAFLSAATLVRRALQQEEVETDPADERLASLELISAVVTGDQVKLQVQLTSRAGTRRTFLAPLTLAPRI